MSRLAATAKLEEGGIETSLRVMGNLNTGNRKELNKVGYQIEMEVDSRGQHVQDHIQRVELNL